MLLGCASDPNKEANDAHNKELQSNREQNEQNAENRSDQRVKAAEAQQKSTTAGAVGTDENKDRVEADAKMKEARDVARAKATERLDKADARTTELKSIVSRKGAKATTKARDSLGTVDQQRTVTKQAIDQLASTPGDNFDAAKKNVDSQLDTLEHLVDTAGKEVDTFK